MTVSRRISSCFLLLTLVGGSTLLWGSTVNAGWASGQADTPIDVAAYDPRMDFDSNGSIELSDFLAFARVFGATLSDAAYDPRMDFDGNGSVDLSDFLAFARVFGTTYSPDARDFESLSRTIYSRFNREREALGLNAFTLADEKDESNVEVWDLAVGCEDPLELYDQLRRPDIQSISLYQWTESLECAIGVKTYHSVPLNERLRVEKHIWECFMESTDLRQASRVSCAGRYTFLGYQVLWLPDQVFYTVVEGEEHRSKFTSLIPWLRETLGIQAIEADSTTAANLFLHFGGQLPAGCGEAWGCNTWEERPEGNRAWIYVSVPDEYFGQVLKHELLHALIPMGHLPTGEFLMSARPDDPSKTHTLSGKEKKLLQLYTSPYLHNGMRMEQFRKYLIIEE